MSAALGAEVALAGWSVGVGDGVVKVAVLGLGVAAGGVAGDGAGADQVGELAARRIAGLGGGMIAARLGDGVRNDFQASEERGETFRLGWVGGPPTGWFAALFFGD